MGGGQASGQRLARSARGRTDFGGVVRAKAFALSVSGQPVFADSGRCNGAEWKRGPVTLVTGDAGMERSGTGSNWRSQVLPQPMCRWKPLPATHRRLGGWL
jgi:hypothetical protein